MVDYMPLTQQAVYWLHPVENKYVFAYEKERPLVDEDVMLIFAKDRLNEVHQIMVPKEDTPIKNIKPFKFRSLTDDDFTTYYDLNHLVFISDPPPEPKEIRRLFDPRGIIRWICKIKSPKSNNGSD